MKSIGGNSGYINYSESVRSFQAKQDGRMPKTLFKKEWQISEKKFTELKDRGIIYVSEWHHTSKFGNKTEFYSINNLPVFYFSIGQKAEALVAYKKTRRYISPVYLNKSNFRFNSQILISKNDDRINELKNLNLKYTRTKRNNYTFYLDKTKLNNILAREIFINN
jgi:hypothetical protein